MPRIQLNTINSLPLPSMHIQLHQRQEWQWDLFVDDVVVDDDDVPELEFGEWSQYELMHQFCNKVIRGG
jgi:hypothetical protein